MWSFRKESKSTASSGVMACDGKYHSWSVWESYEQPIVSVFAHTQVDGIVVRQKRHCLICGFVEDRVVH